MVEPGEQKGTPGIGFLGGTLDPVHIGHLRSAEEVWEGLGLSEVWFAPAACPPHKQHGALTPFHHRFSMVQAAVAPVRHFRACGLEAERPGPSFSIDTLRLLRSRLDKNIGIYFIMGSDAFVDIQTWKDYNHLTDYAHIVVMGRSGACRDKVRDVVQKAFPSHVLKDNGRVYSASGKGDIVLFRVTSLEISSTDIRERLRKGRSVRFLLPEQVLTYIEKHGLYTR